MACFDRHGVQQKIGLKMSNKSTLAARSMLNDLDEILDHLSEWELGFIESISDKLDNDWQLTAKTTRNAQIYP